MQHKKLLGHSVSLSLSLLLATCYSYWHDTGYAGCIVNTGCPKKGLLSLKIFGKSLVDKAIDLKLQMTFAKNELDKQYITKKVEIWSA